MNLGIGVNLLYPVLRQRDSFVLLSWHHDRPADVETFSAGLKNVPLQRQKGSLKKLTLKF